MDSVQQKSLCAIKGYTQPELLPKRNMNLVRNYNAFLRKENSLGRQTTYAHIKNAMHIVKPIQAQYSSG